jgi:hypothetical protein
MARSIAHLASSASLLALLIGGMARGAETSLTLRGIVLDGGDKPLVFARVWALRESGQRLDGETITGADGRFELRASAPVHSLVLAHGESGRVLQQKGPWRADAEVRVDVAAARLFEIRGRITDPGRTLMDGLMDPGARWDGKLDHIARTMIKVVVRAAGLEVLTVHPREDGSFSVKADLPITSLTLRSGGGWTVTRAGPWSAAATVSFDTSSEKVYSLRGKVRDAAGKPAVHARVTGWDAAGALVVEGHATADGSFLLRTNEKIERLETSILGDAVRKQGPWSSDATIDLGAPSRASREVVGLLAARDAAAIKPFTLKGRVTTKSGRPAAGASVTAFDRAGKEIAATETDARGAYQLAVSQAVGLVKARLPGKWATSQSGPWTADASADIALEHE